MNAIQSEQTRAIPRWLHVLWFIPLAIATYFEYRLIAVERGFPLDDAYIYYRYIENLAAGHGLSFNPGETSFGVTSFLYPIFCTVAYWLIRPFGGDIFYAMQIIGLLGHLALTYLAQRFLYRMTGDPAVSLFGGLMLGGCRALYFTGPAGLETTMFHALAIGVLYLLLRKPATPSIYLGAACGALFLTRPEGLMVAAGVAFFFAFHALIYWNRGARESLRRNALDLGMMAVGFFMTTLPYMIFVKIHTDFWMPSTFYGKLLSNNHFLYWPFQLRIKQGFLAILNGYNEILQQDTTNASFVTLIALTLAGVILFIFRSGHQPPSPRVLAAWGTFYAFLLFPFLFGFKFYIHPQFGGYVVRYIQFVIVLIHVAGILTLYQLLTMGLFWLKQPWRRHTVTALLVLIALPWLAIVGREAVVRLPSDLAFYQINAGPKMQIRKQAAIWIRDNTPADSRVLVGRTGLGVVGAFCERYCKDEGGLINPDIYPYLRKFRAGFHWQSMMEYMKHNGIEYYTTYKGMGDNTPETHPTRFTTLAAAITDPVLLARPQDSYVGEIHIYRFRWQERYELWDDLAEYSYLIEYIQQDGRNIQQNVDGRAVQEFWDDRAVIALPATPNLTDLRYDVIMPSEARLRTGLAVRLTEGEFDPEERITFRVAVQYEHRRVELYNESIQLDQISGDGTLAELDLDLSEWSDLYATVILAVISNSPRAEEIRAAWVRPQVINQSLIETE